MIKWVNVTFQSLHDFKKQSVGIDCLMSSASWTESAHTLITNYRQYLYVIYVVTQIWWERDSQNKIKGTGEICQDDLLSLAILKIIMNELLNCTKTWKGNQIIE